MHSGLSASAGEMDVAVHQSGDDSEALEIAFDHSEALR
jgi:hypothetical protein